MKPTFRAEVDGNDITAKIKDRLLSLRVTDLPGFKTDSIEIRLDNRAVDGGAYLPLPPTNRRIDLHLGYKESGLFYIGAFTVDLVGMEGPPDSMVIKAKAAKWMAGLKDPRSRSWHEVTLGDIVMTIAQEHGYQPAISDKLASIAIPHVDQTEESNAHLLTRLAIDHGATFKAAGERLIFVATGEEKSATGRDIEPVTLALKGDVLTWSCTIRDREKYDAVEAQWHDLDAAETKVKRIGEGNRVFRMRHTYADESQAHAAATARLATFRMGNATLDGLTVMGNPKIRAETPIELTGFHPSVPASWVASRVEHVLNSGGFKTTIEAELPKKKALSGG